MTMPAYDPIGVKHECGPVVPLDGVPTIPPDVASQLQAGHEPQPATEARADAAIAAAVAELRRRKVIADRLSPRGNRSYWMDGDNAGEDEEPKPKRKRKPKPQEQRTKTNDRRKQTTGFSRAIKRRRTAARWSRRAV